MTIQVKASNVRETTTGAESHGVAGKDVDVAVALPSGETMMGAVTLLPSESRRGGWVSWGGPDHWVDGRLLAAIKRECVGDDFRCALDMLEAAAAEAIKMEMAK